MSHCFMLKYVKNVRIAHIQLTHILDQRLLLVVEEGIGYEDKVKI